MTAEFTNTMAGTMPSPAVMRATVVSDATCSGSRWRKTGHMLYLGTPKLAMASVTAVHGWRLIPLAAVIMMAGIAAIPQELKDAAEVDNGAGFWRTCWDRLLQRFITGFTMGAVKG